MISGALSANVATLVLAVGLLLSLTCYLLTKLSPGGMITPGWLALTLVEDYRIVAVVALMTAVTYGGATLMQRVVILYGKRLFAAVVLLGVLLQSTVFLVLRQDDPLVFGHQTLGFIVPGLIAYQLLRQPPPETMVATAAVAGASYGILAVGLFAGFIQTV